MRGNSIIAKALCLLVLLNGLVIPSGVWARTAPAGQVDDAILREAGLAGAPGLQSLILTTGNRRLTVLLDPAALGRATQVAGPTRLGVAVLDWDGKTIYWPYDVESGPTDLQLIVRDAEGRTLGTRPFTPPASKWTQDTAIYFREGCGFKCWVEIVKIIIVAVEDIIDVIEKAGDTSIDSPVSTWTPWLNRDNPGSSGDYETLRDFLANGQACPQPLEVECQTTDGRDWSTLNRPYTCNTDVGGVCKNQDQPDRRCPDFRVRFRCP